MQRWKFAGWGPRLGLVAGVVMAVLSFSLYQFAYAAAPPYPGHPGTPGIPNGPSLACNDDNTSNQTWVGGFNDLSTATFKVDGRFAGTSQADSNGSVFVLITFLNGVVSIDGNSEVPDRAGVNYLIVEGKRTIRGTPVTV